MLPCFIFFFFFGVILCIIKGFSMWNSHYLQSPTISEYNRGYRTLCPQVLRNILATLNCMETVPAFCLHQLHSLLKEQGHGKLYLFLFLSFTLCDFYLMMPFPVNQKHTSYCYGVWVDYGGSFQISMISIIFFLLYNLLAVLYSCKLVVFIVGKRKKISVSKVTITKELSSGPWLLLHGLDWYPLPLSY